jgi:hypothetical protein
MINFTRAFDSAWERMHVILFRPFDFGKWCAIGLSAFLAGLLEGGNGFNSSFQGNFNNDSFNAGSSSSSGSDTTTQFDFHKVFSSIYQAFAGWEGWLIVLLVIVIFGFVICLSLLIYWLGSRGEFMFLDNIVRNRASIAWPWQYYARQANSLFGFYLFFLACSFAIFLPLIALMIVACIPAFQGHRWPEGGEIVALIVLGLLYLVFAIVLGVVLFVFREFGVPLMFRQGLLARPAFWEVLGLVRQHPGSVAVFVLLRIAIFIGVAVISVILCCFTCCLYIIPYVGTVMLLPVLIFVRCFTLDCLAQFGPRYEVWTVDVPPPGALPFTPPLPPG